MFTRLIYVSAARQPFTQDDLRQLLEQFRERNHARGLTGILVYQEGSFIQVLEGPAESVDSTYERIRQDPRHSDVRLLSRQGVDERTFGDWKMGFVWTGQMNLAEQEGFSEVMARRLEGDELEGEARRVWSLLQQFKQGRWRTYVTN